MPTPQGSRVVNPAFRAGVPSFAEVADGLPAELRSANGKFTVDESGVAAAGP